MTVAAIEQLCCCPRLLLLHFQVDGDVDSEEEEDEGMGDIDVEAVATIEV